jgi:hypothetical protein
MRYFFDTEFIEDGKTIDLISIGIVAEDGREYYAENVQCNLDKANEWVKSNVIVHLKRGDWLKDPTQIREEILFFVGQGKPEFWAYYGAYDWVALCQLFGALIEIPKGWPYYCRDIKQFCDSLGNPKLPEQGKGEHNALADARWNKVAYDFLTTA